MTVGEGVGCDGAIHRPHLNAGLGGVTEGIGKLGVCGVIGVKIFHIGHLDHEQHICPVAAQSGLLQASLSPPLLRAAAWPFMLASCLCPVLQDCYIGFKAQSWSRAQPA